MRVRNMMIKYREEHKLNQTEFAELIGVTRNQVAEWESGRNNPKLDSIIKLAELFGCTTDFLLCVTDEANENVKVAFYNQHGGLTEEQIKEVEGFIDYLKKRDETK